MYWSLLDLLPLVGFCVFFKKTSRLVAGSLSIQDASVNGTWVNEHRLSHGVRVELQPFDKVSFLPAGGLRTKDDFKGN